MDKEGNGTKRGMGQREEWDKEGNGTKRGRKKYPLHL